ncbi:hypothetical protein NFI96_003046 [Prochilodus magdalenae]|nr:hypothetical protein NFI96_003046 [Prochilodus magdalenae]
MEGHGLECKEPLESRASQHTTEKPRAQLCPNPATWTSRSREILLHKLSAKHLQWRDENQYKAYRITNRHSETLPFILNDVMGLEQKPEDGIHPDDIVNAMLGHIQDGYKFNPASPISKEDSGFIREPSLRDKVQCVVSVVPACSISRIDTGVINKMEAVRNKAVSLGIPHLVVMTKVDAECPLVNEDLQQIYRSRKIKEKMQDCSNKLGSPMKCIFPVSNYYEEIETNDTKDVLILTALLQIVKSAIDYVHENNATYE